MPHALVCLLALSLAGRAPAPDEAASADAPPAEVVLVSSRTAIHRFTPQGEPLPDLVAPGDGGVSFAQQMALGPDGRIYLAQYFGGVEVWSTAGRHLRSLAAGEGLSKPGFVRFEGDALVVSWTETGRITRHAVLDGDRALPDLVRRADGPLAKPHGWLRRDDGSILVCEAGRLSLFDREGAHQRDVLQGVGRILGVARLDERSLLLTDFFGPPRVLDEPTERLTPFTTGRVGQGGDGVLVWGERVLLTYNNTREVLEYGRDGTFRGVFADAGEGLDRANGLLVLRAP